MKTALITGANSGIGKQAAIQLAQVGCRVFVGARNEQRGKAAVLEIKEKSESSNVELLLIDLSSKKSIANAAERLNDELSSLDILIHNAAAFDISQKEPKQSVDGIETLWTTNHLGPILLTNALMDLLKQMKLKIENTELQIITYLSTSRIEKRFVLLVVNFFLLH